MSAHTTPAVVSTSRSPIAPPKTPCGPSAASRAIPATAGGSTSGSSTSVITAARPRKRRVASSHAAGVPTSTISASAAVEQSRLRRSASRDPSSPRLFHSSAGEVSRKIAAIGSVRNATARASEPHQDEPERPHWAGGGSKPAASSASLPAPSSSPSTNVFAASSFLAPFTIAAP